MESKIAEEEVRQAFFELAAEMEPMYWDLFYGKNKVFRATKTLIFALIKIFHS